MLRRIILSIILISIANVAISEKITNTTNSVTIYPITISPPKSTGWKRAKSNPNRVLYIKNIDDSPLAFASLFLAQSPDDSDNILAITKQNIKDMLKQSSAVPITQSYTYTDKYHYPCVESSIFAMHAAISPIQYRFLVCFLPEKDIGYMAAFYYSSFKAIPKLDEEATNFLTGIKYQAPKNEGRINALWNTSDGFGIWIYPESGTCSELRERVKSFIVIGPKETYTSGIKKRISLSDIGFCSQYYDGGLQALCTKGYVDLEYDKEKNEYIGNFEITDSNNFIKKGEFRAAHCDASK